MTTYAGIDCGTNSIRLLVAEHDDRGAFRDVVRRMEIVRLGKDVDRTGRLADEALDRTFAACEDYARVVREHSAVAVRFCATSAARDASNADVFTAGVRERLGVSPEVLTGEEEARLSYAGATAGLARIGVEAPYLVLDIGGGSTEFVIGDGHEQVMAAVSADIGSVRLTERLLHTNPPTSEEISAVSAEIDRMLDGLEVPIERARTLVGVAGTITTVAAMVLGLPEYDSSRIHHARLAVSDVRVAADRLLAMSREERRELPFMHPGRADVIGCGALIFSRVAEHVATRADHPEIVVSEHDILDGIVHSLAAGS
ncbi:MAG: exopolyphosphatase [Propionibacteriales bacterium]|nr:exopolyphosphatase [Propionibacteriales bacterium]